MSLAQNLQEVRGRIREAAERAGRSSEEIELVAVTKTVSIARVEEAIARGLRVFGENRIQEAVAKIDAIGTRDVSWQLIGHLQSNKVRFIEGRFAMVQSVDSVGIVQSLGRRLHTPLDVLIEVNVAEEPQKTGAPAGELFAVASAIGPFQNLRLRGLMTIAPMVADPEVVRPVFRKLRELGEELSQRLARPLPVLSMGMSDDYPIAVEEGATMLRLGRALFGPR